MQTRVVSVIAVKDGKILMGLRRDTGKWNMPGGHVEGNEDLFDAARRELKEETGLEASGLEEIGFCDVRETLRVYSFVCHVEGDPTAKDDPDEEMAAFKWVDPLKMPKSIRENLHNKKDVSLQFIGAQERSLDLIWDEDAPSKRELAAELKKMAQLDYGTPEFQQWFQGSHVKDAQGNPLKVYHGTSKDTDFSTFRIGARGTWFTANPERASLYAGANDSKQYKFDHATAKYKQVNTADRVVPAHLSIKNPYKMTPEDLHAHNHAENYAKYQGELFNKLRAKGHDGVDMGDGTWVAFHPHQIKSIFNNAPTAKPNISKAEDLEKGVNQRLFPYNPVEEISDQTKDQVRRWQSAGKDRKLVPQLPDNAHQRALLRLHSKTSTRRNPISGEREFLLHRGVGSREAARAGSHIAYRTLTSWTPLRDMADFLGEKFNRGSEPHQVLSAWVPESKIHTVIPQFGETRTGRYHENVPGKWESIWYDNRPPGPNDMANEHEIIVKPHRFELVPTEDLDMSKSDSIAELESLEKGAKAWKSKDGVSIPAAGTPERAVWDQKFHEALVRSFANGNPQALRPITIPTEAATGFNMAVNKDRLALYRRMAGAGEPLPPVVVRRSGQGYNLIDGNHRQEAARAAGVPELQAYEIVPLQAPTNAEPKKKVRKDEEEIEGWLAKAVRSSDFKAIGKATTLEGRRFVDHKLQLTAHPPEHNPTVEHYQREVIDGPTRYDRKSQGGGITKKLVYETAEKPPSPQADLFKPPDADKGMNARFMVKPYHEAIVKQLQTYQQFPIQGWAEMANQALYHAAGIGHLHQKVHVAEHDMGPGLEKEPALIIQMAKDFEPIGVRYGTDNAKQGARLIGMMDFLTNNLDRHHQNILLSKDGNDVLAIDHGRSFNYVNNHQYKWTNRNKVQKIKELHDEFRPYIASLSGWGGVYQVDPYDPQSGPDSYRRLENYAPIFDWWGGVSEDVKKAMQSQLAAIKDQPTRDHIWRNFLARAKWLDERAKFGLENYGMDWHRDPVVQYHPDQRSEEEIEAEEHAKARAEWEREQAEAK